MEITSTMFIRVIQLQQRSPHQRLNKRLNFRISFVLLMKSSKELIDQAKKQAQQKNLKSEIKQKDTLEYLHTNKPKLSNNIQKSVLKVLAKIF